MRSFLFVLAAVLVLAGKAFATPLPLSDELLVTNAAGTVLFDGLVVETSPEPTLDFSTSVPQFTTSATTIGVNFREPGTGLISDVLIENLTPESGGLEQVHLTFTSDFEGGPVLDPVPGFFVTETGTLQDLTTLLNLNASGLNVLARSDVDQVPEPSSLLLTGIVLAAAAAFKRWRPTSNRP